MSNGLDIIYFTLFPWENPYSSVSLSFAKEFAKDNRVFYINTPYSIKDYWLARKTPLAKDRRPALLRNKLRYETVDQLPANMTFVMPPLTIPINWMTPGTFYSRLRERNHQVIVQTVRQVIKDHQLKDFIYINCFNPFHGGVMPKSLGQKLNIYQCIDDMTQEPYTARHGARVEEEVIAQADIATVTSKELYNIKSHLNKNTYIVHNAVDISIYEQVFNDNWSRPEEIKAINNKIIGFMGNMDPSRIDYDLLQQIALSHTDKTLLLIGPTNSDEINKLQLNRLPNVILTGSKNIRELPQYVKFMDVALIPFKCNKLTKSIYPLKINEYLAGGRAVVSSNFSEDIRGFSDYIHLADSAEEFIQLIDVAINNNTPDQVNTRRNVAKRNTWTARVDQFWQIVDQHLVNSYSST